MSHWSANLRRFIATTEENMWATPFKRYSQTEASDRRPQHPTRHTKTARVKGVGEHWWRWQDVKWIAAHIQHSTREVRHAEYISDRSYQRRTQSTAYQLFTGIKPDMRKLHPYGAPCTYWAEGHTSKLSPRGLPGIYLGINISSQTYYVLDEAKQKVITTRNVYTNLWEPEDGDFEYCSPPNTEKPQRSEEETQQPDNSTGDGQPQHSEETQTADEKPDRPIRNRKSPPHLNDYIPNVTIDYGYNTIFAIPSSYQEAIESPDREQWKTAMDKEVTTLKENDTWKLTTLPPDRTDTKGKWVYTIKHGQTLKDVQYKARFVARGFSQISGVDYDDTFSP